MVQALELLVVCDLLVHEGLDEPLELPLALVELYVCAPDDHLRGVLAVLAGGHHVAGEGAGAGHYITYTHKLRGSTYVCLGSGSVIGFSN